MIDSRPISIAPYLDVLWRHRIAAFAVLALGFSATVCLMIGLPDTYVSTAVVVVEPPQVAPIYLTFANNLHSEQPLRAGDQLDALAHKAFSDQELAELIHRFDLYQLRPGDPIAGTVGYMSRHIALVVPQDAIRYRDARAPSKAPDVLDISFEYGDARVAQRVTAELASKYIDEAYRERINRADDSLRFVTVQLTRTREKLDIKGNQIKDLERGFQGSLPSELNANLAELARLQDRLADLNARIATQRMALVDGGVAAPRSPEQELTMLQLRLIQLHSEYSDQYPDVVQLNAQIAELKRRISLQDTDPLQKRRLEDSQPGAIGASDDTLSHQAAVTKTQIEALKTRIAATPSHAQALMAVRRDYGAMESNYQKLVGKRNTARMNANLERRHEDERLRLLEPASLPRRPKSPDRLAVGLLGISLSVIVALALPFGLYFTDTSIKQPEEAQGEFGIPVVVSIPELDDAERLWLTTMPAVVASTVGIVAIAVVIWLRATRLF